MVGISIGAINAALIAGNPPDRRAQRLRTFWEKITSNVCTQWKPLDPLRRFGNELSAQVTAALGAPGFFQPRWSVWGGGEASASSLSIYDTAALRDTLLNLIDFDYLNSGAVRLTVGATDITSGNSVIFDTTRQRLGPEHIMASGALPPGLPPVMIDGAWYWDGGVVSNTPLQFVLNDAPADRDLHVYQVDLFSAKGPMPRDLLEVEERQKDIRYSSRTRVNTQASVKAHAVKMALTEVLNALPDDFGMDEDIRLLRETARENAVTIIQLIYRKRPYEGGSKDYEFSRPTMLEHWAAGLADGKRFVELHGQLISQPRKPGVTVIDPGATEDGVSSS